jgi:NAD+ kinase
MSRARLKIRAAAIVAKRTAEEAAPLVRSLTRWLEKRRIRPWIEERSAKLAGERVSTFPFEAPPKDADLMIVLGGDGTLLAAARAMGAKQVPILGVNLGSLGFLTAVALAELYPALEEVIAGRAGVDSRMMLDSELVREGKVLTRNTVLNDVVITKGAIARIIELALEIDDQFVALVRADGIIVSSPTGSTAYSLAAGGPILHPSLGAIILTPICPHTLTHRPAVIPDTARVELTLRGSSDEVYVSFDGQASERVLSGDVVRVSKSKSTVKLVRLAEHNYFQILRSKLRWGERPRARGR